MPVLITKGPGRQLVLGSAAQVKNALNAMKTQAGKLERAVAFASVFSGDPNESLFQQEKSLRKCQSL